MKIVLPILFVLGLHASAKEEEKKPLPSLDEKVFTTALWDRTLEDLKGPEDEESEVDEKLKAKLEEKGVKLAKKDEEGFVWLSSNKNGLRCPPDSFELLGQRLGEVVVRGRDGKPVDVTISIYNRGDDGEIGVGEFEAKMSAWNVLLKERLRSEGKIRDLRGAVATTGWMWTVGNSAILLEGSVNRSEKRPEFIRLRFASVSAAKTSPAGVGRRDSFAAHVQKTDSGFTWIEGVPMVDQGEKGYCVVATVERVARYFGADIDQHEMAQLADTGENGTSGDAMEKAFQRITGKIHLRTIKHIEYDLRQMERDVNNYNRAARAAIKAGVPKVKEYPLDPDDYYIDPRHFWAFANKEVFRDMKASQNGFDHFNRKIKEYVDQGIPLCWTLYLGMFPEKGLPQSYGGHMRLITGYNETTKEIYYTDSWGEGHERKSMRADEAYCMTTALYSMMPSR